MSNLNKTINSVSNNDKLLINQEIDFYQMQRDIDMSVKWPAIIGILSAMLIVFGLVINHLVTKSLEDFRTEINYHFEQIDRRFEQIDRRFEQIDRRFEQMDKRFEVMERKLEAMERKLEIQSQRSDELYRELILLTKEFKSK